MVDVSRGSRHVFAQAHALTELTSVAQAKARPAYWLERWRSGWREGRGDPKSEIRNPKEGRNPKPEEGLITRAWYSGLVTS